MTLDDFTGSEEVTDDVPGGAALSVAIERALRGAKGGQQQSKARTPIIAPDSLHSTAHAQILDLVSEGEIEGFADPANPLTCIYLDETPIANADGSLNFRDVEVDSRSGTLTQDYIPGFGDVENEIGVGVELKFSTPWTQALSNLNLSGVRIRISTPAMTFQDNANGDVRGNLVLYAIDLATNGGSFVQVIRGAINGKTTTKYERVHRVNLPPATTGWSIRVRRLTADTTAPNVQNKTFIESFTEVIDAKLRYPNSALISTRVDASQFQNIPTRAFDLKGRRIRVPSNYDAVTRAYSGIWDGTWQVAYCNNPAWVYLDMVTHPRYGLGHLVDTTQIDKWSLYKIAQYCDGLVPTNVPPRASISTGSISLAVTASNKSIVRSSGSFIADGFKVDDTVTLSGFAAPANNGVAIVASVTATVLRVIKDGAMVSVSAAAGKTVALSAGHEPRFTSNLYLQQRADAYQVIQDLASMFRGLAYWTGGAIVASADQPGDPVYTYTNANVLDGVFTYAGSARRARHTVALVAWSDPADFGRAKIEYVEDRDGIARYGVNQTEVTAIGCTSQSMARRCGLWVLLTERLETDTVTFSIGLDGTFSMPGQVVKIADRNRAGRRMGGRLSASTSTTIIVDALPSPAPVNGDKLTTIKADGTAEVRTISDVNAGLKRLTVSAPFTNAPVVGSAWVVESTTLEAQLVRVLTVAEQEGAQFAITALQHNASKFGAIDFGDPIEVPRTSVIPAEVVPTIASITMSSFERTTQYAPQMIVRAEWPAVAGATGYQVQWRKDEGEWSAPRRQNTTASEFANAFPGNYRVSVAVVGIGGRVSPPRVSAAVAVSASLEPGIFTDLSADIADALEAAENAQAAADGAIISFWQPGPPTIGAGAGQAKVGDIWFDTDNGNKIYRVVGSSWVVAADDDMALALLAATDAQATADGKVKTYFQSTAPTASAIGDLWFNTTTSTLTRWNGTSWSQSVGDITLDQIGGNGMNVLWDEFTVYREAETLNAGTNPPVVNIAGLTSITSVADAAAPSGFMLRAQTGTTNVSSDALGLGNAGNDYNLNVEGGKRYLVSFYGKASVAGHQILPVITDSGGTNHNGTNVTLGSAVGRHAVVIDMTGAPAPDGGQLRFYCNRSGVAGRAIALDRIMVEPLVGNQSLPSPFTPGAAGRNALIALANAALAQATADGKIDSFYQASPPAGASEGDIWFDTDDGNKIYTRRSGSWVATPDSQIAVAIANAAGAQATADGKVTTFYQETSPTATAVGDLWYRASVATLARWNGTAWVGAMAQAPGASGPNLIPNAAFTDNTIGTNNVGQTAVGTTMADGWSLSINTHPGGTSASYVRREASGAMRVNFGNPPVANGATARIGLSMKKSVPCEGSTNYTLSFDGLINQNGTLPGGVTAGARVQINWRDAADGEISQSIINYPRGGSNPGKVTIQSPAGARQLAVTCMCYAVNSSGATWTHNSTVAVYFDFTNVSLTRNANLDIDVDDGPNYGRFSNADGYMSGGFRRFGLRFGASGHRLGDVRNFIQSQTTSYGNVRTVGSLSATSAGAVSVIAHAVRYGSVSVNYSAVSNAVTGLTQGVTYVIYCDDPGYSGGVRSWQAGTNPAAVMALGDGIVVAGQIKIPTSGSGSGGGGGGGSDPNDWCVADDSILVDGMLAGFIDPGETLYCYGNDPERPNVVGLPVTRNVIAGGVECLRLVTASGASLVASTTTPMPMRDGSLGTFPDMLGREALVLRVNRLGRALSAVGGRHVVSAMIRSRALRPLVASLEWERVVRLYAAGRRAVAKISVRDQCYFAGEIDGAFVCSHNIGAVKP